MVLKQGMKLRLGVNVDHVATVRQARYRAIEKGMSPEPNPLEFALEAKRAGAHGITVHLREDRRHIQPHDVEAIAGKVKLPLNLEMATTEAMLRYATRLCPKNVCLVPERREEVTTEGGLDVRAGKKAVSRAVARLKKAGITVSLFIAPETEQVEAAADAGADFVELHTGRFALAAGRAGVSREVKRLVLASNLADSLGLGVNAGHGINYANVRALFDVPNLYELNIGHTLVARSMVSGAFHAVREMLELMEGYGVSRSKKPGAA